MNEDIRSFYETDYYTWVQKTVRLLREGRLSEVDLEHLVEEVEDLGKSLKRELVGFLAQSFSHLIKYRYLLDRSPGDERKWRVDAQVFWRDAMRVLRDNPGLNRAMDQIIDEAWEKARSDVFRSFEEFNNESDLDTAGIPGKCSFPLGSVLSGDFLPQSNKKEEQSSKREHMPNIIFVLDEELLREVKLIATRYDTSLNALVEDYFRHLAHSGLVSKEGELNGNLETLFRYSIGHLTRKEACETLGTDDARLTQLLRMAGFPPPRSPKAEEDAQVEKTLEILGDFLPGQKGKPDEEKSG